VSAIQIVCAVAVPLLWGYQFVAIKVGVMEFPPRLPLMPESNPEV
jgi:O-acetylserine/cysteine efflux transporter